MIGSGRISLLDHACDAPYLICWRVFHKGTRNVRIVGMSIKVEVTIVRDQHVTL